MNKAEIIKLVIEFSFYAAFTLMAIFLPIAYYRDEDTPVTGWAGLILCYAAAIGIMALASSLVWMVFNGR